MVILIISVFTKFKNTRQNPVLFRAQQIQDLIQVNFLQSQNRSYLIDNSIEEISKQLAPNQYYRISRQTLMRLSHIEEIFSHSRRRLILSHKDDNEKWVVSRERVRDFKL
ncbi:LytTR family transcriptional regulator DNA-binding domain-containing protein [Profundicola chukchiensis]|uniref:LytTR family transcriptional regulator DNA-binding domain-containing protein n=1 Tax=Profundicola chukchiensis TaxID=2961959 RepID=UPI0034E24841